jgi:hypothetical protein
MAVHFVVCLCVCVCNIQSPSARSTPCLTSRCRKKNRKFLKKKAFLDNNGEFLFLSVSKFVHKISKITCHFFFFKRFITERERENTCNVPLGETIFGNSVPFKRHELPKNRTQYTHICVHVCKGYKYSI